MKPVEELLRLSRARVVILACAAATDQQVATMESRLITHSSELPPRPGVREHDSADVLSSRLVEKTGRDLLGTEYMILDLRRSDDQVPDCVGRRLVMKAVEIVR